MERYLSRMPQAGWLDALGARAAILLGCEGWFFLWWGVSLPSMAAGLALTALICLALRLWKKPTPLRALLFSLAGALAANTKIVGLAIWGMLSVAALVSVTARKQWSRSAVLAALTAMVSFGGFFLLLTPAAWDGPLEYFQYVLKNASQFSRWTGVVLFRGQRYDQAIAPLPRSYLPRMMLYTLPLYFFPLCAAGQLAASDP